MSEITNRIIQTVRRRTPLWLRWKIGPVAAYISYLFRIYILRNKDAPKVLSINETLNFVSDQNLSIIRFGDGEITLMDNNDLLFQKADTTLIARLKEVLQSNLPGLLICLPDLFGKLEDFTGDAYKFALHHQFRYRHEWLSLLSPSQTYGNTLLPVHI